MTGRSKLEAELMYQAENMRPVVNALVNWIDSQQLSVLQVLGALSIVLARTLLNMPKGVRDEMTKFTISFILGAIKDDRNVS